MISMEDILTALCDNILNLDVCDGWISCRLVKYFMKLVSEGNWSRGIVSVSNGAIVAS